MGLGYYHNKKEIHAYVFHCRLSDPVRMFPDVLQEVFQVGHRRRHDVVPQVRDRIAHHLREAVVTDAG